MALPQLLPTSPGIADNSANFVLQIDTAAGTTLGTGTWVTVFGIQTFVPLKTDNAVDVTTFDTPGWIAQQLFLSGWTNQLSLLRSKYAGAYDVGQEQLRAQNEAKTQVHVRWFDRNGSAESYEGFGFATWEAQSGGPNDKRQVNCNIIGNGTRSVASNPVATNSVISITSATPSGIGVGGLVRVGGTFMTSFVSATVGGVTIVTKDAPTDQLFEFVMPAGSAGSAPIIITNATGASNSFPYTRT